MIDATAGKTGQFESRRATSEYWELARRLFASASEGPPIQDFVTTVVRELHEVTGSRRVELCMRARTDIVTAAVGGSERAADMARACLEVIAGTVPTGDANLVVLRIGEPAASSGVGAVCLERPAAPFTQDELDYLRQIALQLELALQARLTNASLRERMKELTCLYNIALLVEQPSTPYHELLQGIVEVIPAALLHPELAWVHLELDGQTYTAGDAVAPGEALTADLMVRGHSRGRLRVGYARETPSLDLGPFLKEERSLVDTVAREIALIVERREVAESHQKLREQLLHTERLATIGELTSGLAHELNDPLNNILGYAQLLEKETGLSEQGRQDVRTIVDSALHTRQVIQQLLLFSRRMPQRRIHLDVVDAIRDAAPFLQALCAKSGARLELLLDAALPPVSADPDQFRQILVNLVVNATQAIPAGGRVAVIATLNDDTSVRVSIEDNGTGMSEEIAARAFQPFFTTRGDGTGMGLAVVEGIVTAHGGRIAVRSTPAAGTTFDIILPVTS